MVWDQMAIVGRIARAHGNRGQVIVNAETDFAGERFRAGARVFVLRAGRVEPLTITSVRFQGARPVIALAGVDTMDAAEALAGAELRIPAEQLVALSPGVYYQHDLAGCRVETPDGGLVGVVERVEGDAGGHRLVVRGARGEILIPLAAAICSLVDPAARRIVVEPPEGLLDLNE
jgi:16S rRNA processing protein RimM